MAAGSVMPCCISIAATPETCGVAIDVPMKKKYASESNLGATNFAGVRLKVSTRSRLSVCWRTPPAASNPRNEPPGAAISTHGPVFE